MTRKNIIARTVSSNNKIVSSRFFEQSNFEQMIMTLSNIYFSQHYYFKADCITRSFTSSNRFTFRFKLVFNHNISKPLTFRLLYNYWVFLSFLKMIVHNWDNWETREFKRGLLPHFSLWGFVCFHCFCVFDFLDFFSMSPHLLCVISLS